MERNEIREGTFQHFVETVDSLERGEKEQDFSRDAELALYRATQAFNKRAEMVEAYIPSYASLDVERRLFEQSLQKAQSTLDARNSINKRLLDRLITDIETSFFQDPEANELMERTFISLIAQDPPRDADGRLKELYEGHKDYFTNPYLVLETPAEFGLNKAPYGQRILSYAFDRAARNGDFNYMTSWYFNEANSENYETLLWRAAKGLLTFHDPVWRIRLLIELDKVSAGKPGKRSIEGAAVMTSYERKNKHKILEWVGPERMRVLLLEAARKKPTEFFHSKYDFGPLPGYSDAILVAFQNIQAAYRLSYLEDVRRFMDERTIDRVIEETLAEIMESDPSKVFRSVQYVQNILPPQTSSFYVKKAALLDPKGALDQSAALRALPEGERILQKAALLLIERDYPSALTTFIYNMSIPYPADYKAKLIEHGLAYYPDILYKQKDSWKKLSTDPEWNRAFEKAKLKVDSFEKKRAEAVNVLLKSIPDKNLPEEYGGGPRRRREELLRDPALAKYPLVDLAWLPISNRDTAIAVSLMVLRHMDAQKISFSEENFKESYKKIEEAREQWGRTALFEGRNVLLLSHSETYRDVKGFERDPDKDRFGNPELTAEIQRRQGRGTRFEHLEPRKKSFESVKEKKAAALKAVESMPSPMTFIFDGHGWDRAIYLSDGQVNGSTTAQPIETEETIKISVVELARAFKARQDSGKNVAQDLLILAGCNNYLFAANLYQELKTLGCKQPAVLTSAEYGQYGFSDYDSRYGNDFWDAILKKPRPSLGDFWALSPIEHHNPTVFVPTENGPIQLAAAEKEDEAVLG